MIPKNIKREHILKAIEKINVGSGIPKDRQSKKFQLSYKNKFYPPKYVISLANKYANEMELIPSEFSGGQESNGFLVGLGFNIVEPRVSKPKTPHPRIEKVEEYRHDERCSECKNTIIEMFRKIYGIVKVDYKIKIPARIEEYADKPYYRYLKKILVILENYRGKRDFIRLKTLHRCDLYVPNPGFVVELDESQHFTAARKLSLSCYPKNLNLGFDIRRLKELCERIDAKDNNPIYRDEQRAWYDTLRDFLPLIKGLNPTIRLFMQDFQWCILNPEKPSDVKRFKSLIAIEQKHANDGDQMRFVLCVPVGKQSDKHRVKYKTDVAKFARSEGADLVVFPEAYLGNCKYEGAVDEVKKLAEELESAVLTGVSTEEGYQLAIFCNPKPKTGETRVHRYIKHSSAKKLAYKWPEYKGKDDSMFNPIILRQRKIGVMICHDMFFPLITHNLVKRGAEILIDLTGGNVKFQKWNDIIRGRSLEIEGPFLCTMGGHRVNKSGKKSSCIVYERGRKVPFLIQQNGKTEERLEGPRPPGFAMVSVPSDSTISENEDQPFSNKNYSDIIVSFDKGRKADLEIIKISDEIKISSYGKVLHPDVDDWRRVEKEGIIGLLILPLINIKDRSQILKKKPQSRVDFHFVLYAGKKSEYLANSDLVALAKLRAIENRVGVLILTDETREALKTNNYKNIQRFKEQNGTFGFDKNNLKGPESIFTPGTGKGIPEKFKDEYFKLL